MKNCFSGKKRAKITLFKIISIGMVLFMLSPFLAGMNVRADESQEPRNLVIGLPETAFTASQTEGQAYREPYRTFHPNHNYRWATGDIANPPPDNVPLGAVAWIQADLGDVYGIERIELYWEGAFARHFVIQVAEYDEGVLGPFVTVFDDYDIGGNARTGPGPQTIVFNSLTGQVVRMLALEQGTPWGISLHRFEIWGGEPAGPHQVREWHVCVTGSDSNPGTAVAPFRNINTAADLAMPGDTVIVHPGLYREMIRPARGGDCEDTRITYRSAVPGEAIVKGSEQITTWTPVSGNVWVAEIPHSFFVGHNQDLPGGGPAAGYNPFRRRQPLGGAQFYPGFSAGDVYLNNEALNQRPTLANVLASPRSWFSDYHETGPTQRIYANFGGVDPNFQLAEINVRRQIFTPRYWGLSYITVDGFTLMHAANWYSDFPDQPQRAQHGAVSVYGGRRFIIENNSIINARTIAIDIGLGCDMWAGNRPSPGGHAGYVGYLRTHFHRIDLYGEHIVRNNYIARAGQSGVAGVFSWNSQIIDNVIEDTNDRNQMSGAETAPIKLHYNNYGLIAGNFIRNSQGGNSAGIWVDWGNQGIRVTGNVVINTPWGFYAEALHGPVLVDNNIFINTRDIRSLDASGVVFANNMFINNGRVAIDGHGRNNFVFHPGQMTVFGFEHLGVGSAFDYGQTIGGALMPGDANTRQLRQEFWWYNNLSGGATMTMPWMDSPGGRTGSWTSGGSPGGVANGVWLDVQTGGANAGYQWQHNARNSANAAISNFRLDHSYDSATISFDFYPAGLSQVMVTEDEIGDILMNVGLVDAQVPMRLTNQFTNTGNTEFAPPTYTRGHLGDVTHDFFGNPFVAGSAISGPFADLVAGHNEIQLWPRPGMHHPPVLPPSDVPNLALNPEARVFASFARDGHVAENAIDGDMSTRWSSDRDTTGLPDEWIYVDLGAVHYVSEVILRWEGAFAAAYEIQISPDAGGGHTNIPPGSGPHATQAARPEFADNRAHAATMDWTTVFHTDQGTGGISIIPVNQYARSVRMQGIQKATPWSYSLWEFEIMGGEPVQRVNIARGPAALYSASSVARRDGAQPQYCRDYTRAFDGSMSSRWSSATVTCDVTGLPVNPDDQWIQVDLGSWFEIEGIHLHWYDGGYATAFEIQLIDPDTGQVTVIHQATDNTFDAPEIVFAPAVNGQIIRVRATKRSNPLYGFGINEFEVFGRAAQPPLPVGRFPAPILGAVPHAGPFTHLADPMIGPSNTIPASYMRWVNALPAGNGRYGIMVFGNPLQEITIFNDVHMFMARPEPVRPGHPQYPRISQYHRQFNRVDMADIEFIRQQLLLGTREGIIAANQRANQTHGWTSGGEGTKHPAFYMSITHAEDGQVRNHYRYTDYRDGYINVRWEDNRGEWERVSFVSRADNVTVQYLTPPSDENTFDTHIDLTIHNDMGLLQRGFTYERNNCLEFLNLRVHYGAAGSQAPGGGPLYSGWPNPHTGSWNAGYEGVTQVITDGTRVLSPTGMMITDATYVLLLTRTERYSGTYPGRIPGTFELRTPDDPLYEGHYTAAQEWARLDVQAGLNALVAQHGGAGQGLFTTLFNRHAAQHRDIMERVTISFEAPQDYRAMSNEQLIARQRANPTEIIAALYERAFYSGRYLFLGASGENYAPDLLGNWTGNAGAGWGGFYHMNANINLQISSGHIGDMPEAMAGFIWMMQQWQEDFRFNAYMLLGTGRDRATDTRIPGRYGMLVGGNTPNTEGLISSLNFFYPYHYVTGGMGFLLYPIWEWYLITGDRTFLEEIYYPLIRDMAYLYEDYLLDRVVDNMFPAGHPLGGVISTNPDHPLYPLYDTYIFVGSISSETQPTGGIGAGHSLVLNAVYDIAGARFALSSLLYTARELGYTEAEVARWQELYDHLPPYLVNDHGSFAEWAWPTHMNYSPYPHRHSSGLMPFWPYRTVTYEEQPELWHAGRQFVGRKHDRGTYERSGHGRQHASLIAANSNYTRVVRDNLIDVGMNFFWNSLATAHDYVTRTQALTSTDYCQDTSASVPTVLMEMLATTNVGRLELIPALPLDFRSGYIRGMRGRSQFTINELTWNLDDLALEIEITSLIDQDLDVILRKGITGYEILAGNPTVSGFSLGTTMVDVRVNANERTRIRFAFRDVTRVNLALEQPTSGSFGDTSLAVDGEFGTSWISGSEANPYISVDLGDVFILSDVEIYWGADYAANYTIQVSIDGISWTNVAKVTGGQGGHANHVFENEVAARFVRMRSNDLGPIAISEFEVYGERPPDIARNRPATALSTTTQAGQGPSMAVDGQTNTRWGGGQVPQNWFQVQLDDVYDIFRVFINWEASHSRYYRIEVSMDGVTWETVYTVENHLGGYRNHLMLDNMAEGRYIRMITEPGHGTGPAGWGISMWCFEVYGVRVPTEVEPDFTVTFHLYTDLALVEDTFGNQATRGANGFLVIEVPVTPGAAASAWEDQELLAEVFGIGHIYGTTDRHGYAFRGWFDDETLDDSGRIRNNLRRPDLIDTCLLADILEQIEDATAAETLTLFGSVESGNLDVFGVWVRFGDVDDNALINMTDLAILQRFTNLGHLMDVAFVQAAADVVVDGLLNMADLQLLQRHTNVGHLMPVVLGAEPQP